MLPLFDEDEDGEINVLEAENVQNVNCSEKNIADLSGLEKCPNLKYLNCNGNYISEIILPNLSKLETIIAYGNPIEKIDVNNDAALVTLNLQNVSTNALSGTGISIVEYNQAETLSLDFSGTKYTSLTIKNSTVLTSYDVSKNVQLTELNLCGNSLVKSVDVSTLTALNSLQVWGCALESLDVDTIVNLETLMCYNNKLSSLNLDNNIALKSLDASNNILTSLKLQNNIALTDVNVENNQLQSLNVRRCTQLISLNVGNNPDITALALGYNVSLQTLKAHITGLTDIDLSANTNLLELDLNGCSGVKVIDLSANTLLNNLNLSSTSIATIDVSKNTKLTDLNVSSTNISALVLTNNTLLTTLKVSGNIMLKTIDVTNTKVSALDVSSNTSLESLKINGCPISSLKIPSGQKSLIAGQYIIADGVKGVMFYYKKKVRIVSIDENDRNWGYDGTKMNTDSWDDGAYNTNKIINGSSAAIWCRAKGEKWYLPAINELEEILNGQSDINNCLGKISGAKQISSTVYLSSTEQDAQNVYVAFMSNGEVKTMTTRKQSLRVRAVRVLE